MKRWIGRWLMGVAVLHTVVGILLFTDTLRGIFSDGFLNSLGDDPVRYFCAWFFLSGFSLFVLGLLADWVESNSNRPLPSSLGWGLLAISTIGLSLMPVSGFWLLLPPSIALITRRLNTGGK
jgi:hypothetical protein